MTPLMNISGLILSAGESTRMGSPKANLKFKNGKTLLETQVSLLKNAGCKDVCVVVGAHSKEIIDAHKNIEVSWIENKNWREGQFSSIKIGLDFLAPSPQPSPSSGEGAGVILLPVDVPLIPETILAAIIETALRNPHLDAVIPEYEGHGGHPIFLSAEFCRHLSSKDNNSRLDRELAATSKKIRLPVNYENVTKNVNTPEEWKKLNLA